MFPKKSKSGDRRTSRRILHGLWIGIRAFSWFMTALFVVALVGVNLRPVRAIIVRKVDAALENTFAGKVVIESIDSIGLTGIGGARVHVADPAGRQLLRVDDATIRVAVVPTVKSLLDKKGDLVIDVASVKIGYVDADVSADEKGQLRLAQAFLPKEPKEEKPEDPNARKTAIRLRKVTLEHAWVHGQPAGAPYVDTDLDHLDVSALAGGNKMSVDLARLDVATRGMPNGADLHTRIVGEYAAPADDGHDKAGKLDLKGDVGGVPFTVHGSIDGADVAAVLDVPKITPENAEQLAPGLSPSQDLSAHAEAHGRLPDLEAKLNVVLGRGAIDVTARATLSDEKVVHAKIVARDVDARAVARTAPVTDLGLDAAVDLRAHPSGAAEGTFSVDTLRGSAAGNVVPPAHVRGEIHATPDSQNGTTVGAQGSGSVDETGAPVRFAFDARKVGATTQASFQVDGLAVDLRRTRLGSGFAGSAEVHLKGTATVSHTTEIDVSADVRAGNVAHADQRVDRAWLRAHVRGTTDNPAIDAIFQGTGVAAGGMKFANTAVTSHGDLRATDVTVSLAPIDAPRIDARANVALTGKTTLRDVRVAASRDDVKAVLQVARAELAGSDVRVEGLTLEGLGSPLTAELRKSGHDIMVRAATSEIDLDRVARLLRLNDVKTGRAALDVDLLLRKNAMRGHLRADLDGATLARVKNASAHANATFEGRRLDAAIRAELGEIGRLDVEKLHVEVEGDGPLDGRALGRAIGAVALDSRFDVSRIRALFPRGSIPFSDMQGQLHVKGEVSRTSPDEFPTVDVAADTRGLYLSGRGDREQVDGVRVYGVRPWSLEGVDVELAATVAKDSGATTLRTRLFDKQGTLASLDASAASVPYRDWLRAKSLDPDRLGRLPIAVELAVPRRDLKRFPAMLKTQQMGGDVAAKVDVDGTLAEPNLKMLLETHGFTPPLSKGMPGLDAKIDGDYRQGKGSIDADVRSQDRQLLAATLRMTGRLPGLSPRSAEEATPWRAATNLKIQDFPLETLGVFTDLQIKGFASGEASVAGIHEDAKANAHIALRDLKLGRAKFPHGDLQVDFDGRAVKGALRLDQTDGSLQTSGQVGMTWGAETAPSLDTEQPAFVQMKANRFRAAAMLPFLSGTLSELDGRIDADTRIDIVPNGGGPKMRGSVNFSEGLVQLARLGEPLHGVTARVLVTPDGLVRLDDLTARGSTGRLDAKAVARLNGFKLVGARATLRIPQRDPLPVDVDGQDMGDMDGDVNLAADMSADQKALNVTVDIPRLHTQLPLSSSHKAQELGEAPKIRVGYYRRPRQFIILPKDAEDLKGDDAAKTQAGPGTKTTVSIHLGDDVVIRKGTTLKVFMTGNPKIEMTDQARMSGQIRLTRGILEVQGKRFEIEKGTVTFVGDDPSDPQIVVTAGWDAPDGTRVYADFVGPLKTGKVKLRSEPPRPQNEILALIMFGTAEGSSSTPYPTQEPDGATRAGTMAGGFATEGLSKGLDELTGLEVSTKIDTSNSANPKPEVEVQIARDISLQIGYVLGTPPPGTNPDKTLLTVDWRFKRNWSMDATFGDQGSSIMDVIWQYRY